MITAYVLVAMWFSWLGGVATKEIINEVQNPSSEKQYTTIYRIGVDYNSGNTQYICEEPAK